MALIQFGDQKIDTAPEETVLDTLLRKNIRIPWSCRAGLCHSCIMQATSGTIPPAAQLGLTPDQKKQNMLLACQCIPKTPMTLQLLRREHQPIQAIVTNTRTVTPTLLELTLSPILPISYRPGQFICLSRDKDEQGNRYTLVSRPWAEPDLRIHIARRAGGVFSSWLFDNTCNGMRFWLHGLGGECCYHPDRTVPLVLFGSGPGIGAALAVADDALWHKHSKSVAVVVHGDENLGGQKHSVPADKITEISSNDFGSTVLDLVSRPDMLQAHWILFGKPKKVQNMMTLLEECNILQEKIQPLAYRTGS